MWNFLNLTQNDDLYFCCFAFWSTYTHTHETIFLLKNKNKKKVVKCFTSMKENSTSLIYFFFVCVCVLYCLFGSKLVWLNQQVSQNLCLWDSTIEHLFEILQFRCLFCDFWRKFKEIRINSRCYCYGDDRHSLIIALDDEIHRQNPLRILYRASPRSCFYFYIYSSQIRKFCVYRHHNLISFYRYWIFVWKLS